MHIWLKIYVCFKSWRSHTIKLAIALQLNKIRWCQEWAWENNVWSFNWRKASFASFVTGILGGKSKERHNPSLRKTFDCPLPSIHSKHLLGTPAMCPIQASLWLATNWCCTVRCSSCSGKILNGAYHSVSNLLIFHNDNIESLAEFLRFRLWLSSYWTWNEKKNRSYHPSLPPLCLDISGEDALLF